MAEPTQYSIPSLTRFTERVLLWTDIVWQSEWLGGRILHRKSPFTDGYNMAERMARMPHFYIYIRMSPFTDGYNMAERMARMPHFYIYIRMSPFMDGYFMEERLARRPDQRPDPI